MSDLVNATYQEFPVEVFPELIKKYILTANKTLNFPIDYLGAGILYTSSLLIGNTTKLKIKNGWNESPILYIAIVGKPGINKSHAISFTLKPVFDREFQYLRAYQKELESYNSLAYEEKIKQTAPILRQLLIQDITPETISQVHNNNPRGVGYYRDELIAWLNDFNRYHKGSDEQFWLSSFSNIPIRINRINKPTLYIRSPYIPVIGSIQPEVLTELFSNKRRFNGFTDRILFVYPDQVNKPYWKEEEMPTKLIEQYSEVMNNFFNTELKWNEFKDIDFKEVTFQEEAKLLFTEWFNKNVDEFNKQDTDSNIAGTISKLDIICGRLSLILQAIDDACKNQQIQYINSSAVQGAIQLVEYFKQQAEKAYNHVKGNSKQLLSSIQLKYYQELPDEFNRSQANNVAQSLDIHLKTAEKYLEYFLRYKLIEKPIYNKYCKILA